MRFDDWTAEAHRSLQAWDPEPAARPTVGAAPASEYDEVSPMRDRRPVPAGRRLLAAVAAAAVIAAGAVAATTLPSSDADTDVAVGATATSPLPGPTASTDPVASTDPGDPTASTVPGDPTDPTATTTPVTEPADPPEPAYEAAGRWSTPYFDCGAADENGVLVGGPTDAFDASPYVAEWRAIDFDDPEGGPPASGPIDHVEGTMVGSEDEDLATTRARGEMLRASLAPTWGCNLYSPMVDVTDPSQPGTIVDEHNVATNRLGGMCLVPDATADPDAVWGVDPSLAAAIDQVDGVTEWQVILADGGDNNTSADQLWMEFSFEADPGDFEADPFFADADVSRRVEADMTAVVEAAGAAAGVATRCGLH